MVCWKAKRKSYETKPAWHDGWREHKRMVWTETRGEAARRHSTRLPALGWRVIPDVTKYRCEGELRWTTEKRTPSGRRLDVSSVSHGCGGDEGRMGPEQMPARTAGDEKWMLLLCVSKIMDGQHFQHCTVPSSFTSRPWGNVHSWDAQRRSSRTNE